METPDIVVEEYNQLLKKAHILSQEKSNSLIPFHIYLMFEMKQEKQNLIELIQQHFNGSAEHWDILLNSRLFHEVSEETHLFRKQELEKLGFTCPYLRGFQLGSRHFIVSLDIKNLNIDINKLLFFFQIFQYNVNNQKHIYLAKDDAYFLEVSIIKTPDGFFSLYDRRNEKTLLRENNLPVLMKKIADFYHLPK